MQKLTIATIRNLTLAVTTTLALGSTGARADSEVDAVKAAEAAYIAAIDSLEPAKLEALWAHDDAVVDYEPGSKAVAAGWENVKKNLEAFPNLYAELKNTVVDGPYVEIKGDVARTVTKTTVAVKMKDGTDRNGEVFQTNVYEKRGGAWLLMSHSASRVPK